MINAGWEITECDVTHGSSLFLIFLKAILRATYFLDI